MGRTTMRFFMLSLIPSVMYWWLGYFLCILGIGLSAKVPDAVIIVLFMLLNVLIYSAIWLWMLERPPHRDKTIGRADYMVLHIPTIFYFVCTIGLLTTELVLNRIYPVSELGVTGLLYETFVHFHTVKLFYQMICPLGLNTALVCIMAPASSTVYYLVTFLNLLLYAVLITIWFKKISRRPVLGF